MKLAYTVATPDTHAKYPAYSGKMTEVLPILKDIGYQGIEPFVRDPRSFDQMEFSRMIEKYGLEVAAVGTSPMVVEDKLTFTSFDEQVRLEAIERTKVVIDFAAQFKAQVNVGSLRGPIHKSDLVQAVQWRDQAIMKICEYAAVKDVNITLEPQNRFAIDNLNTTQEVLAWLKKQKLPNLFIMQDLFHMNIEDQSQASSMIDAKDYCIHIHAAENNRGTPGTGHIDFKDAVRVLKALHYSRYISLEINQNPDSYSAAQASFEYMNRLIHEA